MDIFDLCDTTAQIAHYPSLLSLPADLAIPIVAEVEHYKSALKRCFSAYSASMVTFEVAKVSGPGARAGHAHIQVCPIPDALAPTVEDAFREEGAKLGIEFVAEDSLSRETSGEDVSYFKLGLPDGKALVHLIKPHGRFNLQFGRCVSLCQRVYDPYTYMSKLTRFHTLTGLRLRRC